MNFAGKYKKLKNIILSEISSNSEIEISHVFLSMVEHTTWNKAKTRKVKWDHMRE